MKKTITDFAEAVRTETVKKLGREYKVTIETKSKNNKVVYTGLHIRKKGMESEPLVYLDDYFRQYQNGNMTISEAAECVVSASRKKGPSVDMKQFLEYEKIKDSIVYRLVNTEMNRELLDDLPHIEYLDLSVVFCCLVMEKGKSHAFIWIHNVHLKLWDVTVEELYRTAAENTQRLEKPELMDMEEVLYDVLKEEGTSLNDSAGYKKEKSDRKYDAEYREEEPDENIDAAYPEKCSSTVPVYVLSNTERLEGAACMLYPDLLRRIADRMDSSYYIIPSSIHELLLIPTAGFTDRDEMKAMIREVNDTQVKPEERLSYSLYGYDKKENKIEILC